MSLSVRISPGWTIRQCELSSFWMVETKVYTLLICSSETSPKHTMSTATAFFFSFLANIFNVSISSLMVEPTKHTILGFWVSFDLCLRDKAPIWIACIGYIVLEKSEARRLLWLRISMSWPLIHRMSVYRGSELVVHPWVLRQLMIAGWLEAWLGLGAKRTWLRIPNEWVRSLRLWRRPSYRAWWGWLPRTSDFKNYSNIKTGLIIKSLRLVGTS